MGTHLGGGVLEEGADVLGGAAASRVVKDDGVDVGARRAVVVVRRGHRDDPGLGDAAGLDRLDLGDVNGRLRREVAIGHVLRIVEQRVEGLVLLGDRRRGSRRSEALDCRTIGLRELRDRHESSLSVASCLPLDPGVQEC
ncbi:hypothetical protein D3C72_1947590 [compost metagenome]